MLKIENYEVVGLEHAIRRIRNPMNSWNKSGNGIGCVNCVAVACEHSYDHSFQVDKETGKVWR